MTDLYEVVEEKLGHGTYVTLTPKGPHNWTLIWLHGVGPHSYTCKEHFMDPEQNGLPPGCKIIIPVPPEHKTVKDKGFWYLMLKFHVPERPFDEELKPCVFEDHVNQESLQKSIDMVIAIIKKEVNELQDSRKVFIGGFSRGVGVALGAYLQFD